MTFEYNCFFQGQQFIIINTKKKNVKNYIERLHNHNIPIYKVVYENKEVTFSISEDVNLTKAMIVCMCDVEEKFFIN